MTSQQFWSRRPLFATGAVFAAIVEAAMLAFSLPGNCDVGFSFGMTFVACLVFYGAPALVAAGAAAAVGFIAPRMAFMWGVIAIVMLAVIGVDSVLPNAACSILSGI